MSIFSPTVSISELPHNHATCTQHMLMKDTSMTEEELGSNSAQKCIDCGTVCTDAYCFACGRPQVDGLCNELFDMLAKCGGVIKQSALPILHKQIADLQQKLVYLKRPKKSTRKQMMDTAAAYTKALTLQVASGCLQNDGINQKFFRVFLQHLAETLHLTCRTLLYGLVGQQRLQVQNEDDSTRFFVPFQKSKMETMWELEMAADTSGYTKFADLVRLAQYCHVDSGKTSQERQGSDFTSAARDYVDKPSESDVLKALFTDHWCKMTDQRFRMTMQDIDDLDIPL